MANRLEILEKILQLYSGKEIIIFNKILISATQSGHMELVQQTIALSYAVKQQKDSRY